METIGKPTNTPNDKCEDNRYEKLEKEVQSLKLVNEELNAKLKWYEEQFRLKTAKEFGKRIRQKQRANRWRATVHFQ